MNQKPKKMKKKILSKEMISYYLSSVFLCAFR